MTTRRGTVEALVLALALLAAGACNAERDADPVTVGALQKLCSSTNSPVRVLEASESKLTSAEFELAGPYKIGYGGHGAIPVKIELRSTDGSVVSSSSLPAAGGGLHCVGGGKADGDHTVVVTPQARSTDQPASWELMVVVFAADHP